MTDGRQTDAELKRYYAARAREYERIYEKPERQPDLRRLEAMLPELMAGRRVLELACGTGYWTQFLAPAAAGLVGIDSSTETLELAATKPLPPGRVEFRVADIYDLPEELGRFDGAFAGFWWSHVLKRDHGRFLKSLDARLLPGAKVAFLDNRYVEGSNTAITRHDEDGNTYQARRLVDGSAHEVLKNFPTEEELHGAVRGFGRATQYVALEYYWVFIYEKQ